MRHDAWSVDGRAGRRATAGSARRQAGFTLIELMVGLAVGLVVTLVITQVLAVAEGQKRSTTTGSDAQVNGAVALYAVQRDLQMAGYGLGTRPDALGCELRGVVDDLPLLPADWRLAPVVIVDGVDGAPDEIRLLGSGGRSYSVPTSLAADQPADSMAFDVPARMGVQAGDLMIAVPAPFDAANWCTLFSVTDPAAGPFACPPDDPLPPGLVQVRHDACDNTPWNPVGGDTLFPAAGVKSNGYLLNLGPQDANNRFFKIYDISGNGLRLRSVAANRALDDRNLFPEIVDLQAFYGKDTNNDGTIDRYDTVTPTTNADWQAVRSVRVALVARSVQYEREEVTTANPLWDVGNAAAIAGAVACGGSRCVEMKVDGLADWQHYRYKVFDTVVPLRNLMWSS